MEAGGACGQPRGCHLLALRLRRSVAAPLVMRDEACVSATLGYLADSGYSAPNG